MIFLLFIPLMDPVERNSAALSVGLRNYLHLAVSAVVVQTLTSSMFSSYQVMEQQLYKVQKTHGAGMMKCMHTFIAFVSTRLCAKQMAYVLHLIFRTLHIL